MKLLCLVFIGVVCGAQALTVDKCEGKSGEVVDVRVTGCEKAPCILKKGEEVTIEMDFVADRDVSKLTNNVFGLLGLVKAPFKGVHNTDACQYIHKKGEEPLVEGCKLEKGETYTYSNTFPIKKEYPAISVKVEWSLVDSKKTPIACFILPARINNKA